MTAPPDKPLPGDWPRSRLLGWAVAGQLVLLPVAVRHLFFWGGDLAPVLHVAEAVGLVLATLLSGVAFGRCVRQASSLDLSFLLRGAALLTALALLVPPFLSSDVFDYVARGRVEALGHNPYLVSVHELAADPAMAAHAERAQWPQWVMPYGPLAAAAQWLAAQFPSPWVGVYCWKLLSALAHLGAGWLLFSAMRRLWGDRDARRGLVLWLWNPWLLLENVGSAHNDAVQALLLAAMVAGVASGRAAGATASYGASVLWKHGSAPLGPLLLAWAFWQKKLRGFAAGVAVVAAATLLAWAWYFRAPGALEFLTRQAGVEAASIPAMARWLLGDGANTVVAAVGGLLTLAVLAFGCRRARDAVSLGPWGVLAMAVFLLLAVPNFAPWYHLWWLPLFALCNAPVVARVVELLGWMGMFSYLVFVGTRTLGTAHQVWQFALAGLWPLGLLLMEWRRLAGLTKKKADKDEE